MAGVTVNWTEIGPIADDAALVASNTLVSNNRVVLEEFAFTAHQDNNVQTIANWLKDNALPSGNEYGYWRQALPQRLVILHENAFRDFTQSRKFRTCWTYWSFQSPDVSFAGSVQNWPSGDCHHSGDCRKCSKIL